MKHKVKFYTCGILQSSKIYESIDDAEATATQWTNGSMGHNCASLTKRNEEGEAIEVIYYDDFRKTEWKLT